ncbi:hypothetical protein C7413_1507 [Paraburkholderia silvatlantica]|uniref:Uncharacterized protein n=1 Tax=Paraburkholderia silvatlantica TaxID=321895 RepID=A0A2U0ZGB1_9BURK|nr:hypothetical protein C7411_1467 [Paraburkholderia silvatlantica]PXW23807.1 hypothetical protein C7413_1507 [Paraburkholderia silvatlantica]PYE12700.1 hypothetical protein C7410_1538 [Paraburkholderia silvatlantica]TDQ73598.1 hypothetical protein C7412_1468 [Paraburkholderia silvatlantica]
MTREAARSGTGPATLAYIDEALQAASVHGEALVEALVSLSAPPGRVRVLTQPFSPSTGSSSRAATSGQRFAAACQASSA